MGNLNEVGLKSKPDFIAPALDYPQNLTTTDSPHNITHFTTTTDSSTVFNSLFDRELDDILNQIEQESKDEDAKQFSLDLVPKQNIIKSIRELFEVQKQLGKGASGTVLLVTSRMQSTIAIITEDVDNTNNIHEDSCALKELCKLGADNRELFVQEVQIMKKIQQNKVHPNIVKYIDCFMDDYSYYIALEYEAGGTVLERIIKREHFSERDAANWIQTILKTVEYIHSLDIVHRDLKADNFIFDSDDANANLKIIDFGNSHEIVDPDDDVKLVIGGKHYLPPESFRVRKERELKKGDMWMIGVSSYIFLTGRYPFQAKSDDDLFHCISKGKYKWPKKNHLSDTCKDFIQQLLCKDVEHRLSASDALKHPWITGNASDEDFGSDHIHLLKTFAFGNRLQHILLNTMLSSMDAKEKLDLILMLKELHLDKNGQLNFDDVIHYMLVHTELKENSTRLTSIKSSTTSSTDMCFSSTGSVDIDGILREICKELNDITSSHVFYDHPSKTHLIGEENKSETVDELCDMLPNFENNASPLLKEFNDTIEQKNILKKTVRLLLMKSSQSKGEAEEIMAYLSGVDEDSDENASIAVKQVANFRSTKT